MQYTQMQTQCFSETPSRKRGFYEISELEQLSIQETPTSCTNTPDKKFQREMIHSELHYKTVELLMQSQKNTHPEHILQDLDATSPPSLTENKYYQKPYWPVTRR